MYPFLTPSVKFFAEVLTLGGLIIVLLLFPYPYIRLKIKLTHRNKRYN